MDSGLVSGWSGLWKEVESGNREGVERIDYMYHTERTPQLQESTDPKAA